MISTSTRSKIFSRVSATTVVIALIILSTLQYRWVTSSAEKNLTELYRSFSYRIQAAISEKFSFFPFLGDRFEYFGGMENEEELQDRIAFLYNTGISTFDTRYLTSMAYSLSNGNSRTFNLLTESGWEVTTASEEMLGDPRRIALIPDRFDPGKVWISTPLPPIDDSEKNTILFQFDILSFYQNEIEKSQLNSESHYQLEWHYDLTGEVTSLVDTDYEYSPFRIIREALTSTQKPWLIEIPLQVIIFNEEENKMFKLMYNKEKPDRDSLPIPTVYVDVLSEGKSLIKEREVDLTTQWLLSLLLIIGIGIAYIVILAQINHLRRMRNREKEFVASVTHELRTPLTVINAAADNITNGILSPDRLKQYGKMITDQSTRLASMIEGILLFSRLEGKAEQPPLTKKIIFSEMNESLDIFSRSVEKEMNKNITIDFRSLPKEALSDRETLELILTNLISNSAKHAYGFGIKGEIRVKGHVQLPNTLIFTVEDDGSGIDKIDKKHIYDPFYRGKKSLHQQIKGSGLGLYLSMRKARLLGGSLKLTSPYERVDGRLKKGCHFTLRIPYFSINNGE